MKPLTCKDKDCNTPFKILDSTTAYITLKKTKKDYKKKIESQTIAIVRCRECEERRLAREWRPDIEEYKGKPLLADY